MAMSTDGPADVEGHVEGVLQVQGTDADEGEEDGSRQGDPGEDLVDELGGAAAGADAGDEPAGLLEVLADFLGVVHDGRVEVGEEDDEHGEDDGVDDMARAGRRCRRPGPCSMLGTKEASWAGTNMMAEAKMTGMTPAVFTLKGRKLDWPPITLRPTTRLGLWRGMRRVPWSMNMMKAVMASTTSDDDRLHGDAALAAGDHLDLAEDGAGEVGHDADEDDEGDAVADAAGVICSPSHMMNMVPVVRVRTHIRVKPNLPMPATTRLMPVGVAWPASQVATPRACRAAMPMVR